MNVILLHKEQTPTLAVWQKLKVNKWSRYILFSNRLDLLWKYDPTSSSQLLNLTTVSHWPKLQFLNVWADESKSHLSLLWQTRIAIVPSVNIVGYEIRQFNPPIYDSGRDVAENPRLSVLLIKTTLVMVTKGKYIPL